jgi:hypothetical protein
MAAITHMPSEKEQDDVCELCTAPLLPGQGMSQYGFFYCGQKCREEHAQSACYADTKSRADALSEQLGGAKRAIKGDGVESLASVMENKGAPSNYRPAGRGRQCAVM